MPTNLAIDDQLLEEALVAGKLRTKRETVNQALREFIARRRRERALEDLGRLDLEPYTTIKRARRR